MENEERDLMNRFMEALEAYGLEVGTRLECSRGFIDAVAKKVYDLKKGAKPIKSVIDESLAYVDHAAISGVIPKVKVYKKTVEDPDKFEYFK